MNVLVIGANGQVGQHVIDQLKDRNHKTTAMVRKQEQVDKMKQLGADEVIVADLEGDFSKAFQGQEALFSPLVLVVQQVLIKR